MGGCILTDLQAAVDLGVRIARVETIALSAPFSAEFGDDVPEWLLHPAASHSVMPREGQYACLVKITADDGTVGVGECYGLPSPEVTATVVRTILTPLLIGQDPIANTAIWQRMFSAQAAGGRLGGFYLEAIAGVDLALWDLRGKLLGLPVHRLLGGPIRERIECYASPVPLLEDPDESARQALRFVEEGFRAVKVKIGRGLRTDSLHLRAVRDAVGPAVTLLTDANCAYQLDEATAVAEVLRTVEVTWFEEPLAVDDIRHLAELRRRTGLTIVNGETQFTSYDLRESMLADAIDVFMPNVARCGGLTEAMRIAAIAAAFHVDIAPHGVGSGVSVAAALQLMAAAPNGRIYEYNRLPNALREGLVVEFPEFRDGTLAVPTAPGLGVELNDDVVDRYRIDLD